MIQGTGGKAAYVWDPADSEAAYFEAGFSGTYGFAKFSLNLSAIKVDFVRPAGGNDADSFMIETPEMVRPPLPPKFLPGFDLVGACLAVASCAAASKYARTRAR